MSESKRFTAVDPSNTTAKNKEVYQTIEKAFGRVPNSFRVLGNSEAFLGGYWNFDQALEHGKLRPGLRTEIALTVSQINQCPYCLSAFTALGHHVGLEEQELERCRLAHSDDPKIDAALQFAKAIVLGRGTLSDEEFANVRAAGYTDTEIIEIVGNVALITCANYINLVGQTEIDFPPVRPDAVTAAI